MTLFWCNLNCKIKALKICVLETNLDWIDLYVKQCILRLHMPTPLYYLSSSRRIRERYTVEKKKCIKLVYCRDQISPLTRCKANLPVPT